MAFRKERTTAKEIDALLKKKVSPYHAGNIDNKIMASLLKISEAIYDKKIKDDDVPYKEILDYCIEIDLDPTQIFYKNISRLRILE